MYKERSCFKEKVVLKKFLSAILSAFLYSPLLCGSFFAYTEIDHKHHGNEEYESNFGKKYDEISSKEVVHERLKAIVITSEQWAPKDYVLQSCEGVEFYRAPSFLTDRDRKKLTAKLSKQFLDKPLTYAMLEKMKLKIQQFYKDRLNAFVIVSVPEQDFRRGNLVVSAFPARLGRVEVTGNRWFQKNRFEEELSIREDEVIESRKVLADLSQMNANPFHKVDVVYRDGDRPGFADLELRVQDKRPLQIYAGSNNNGYQETDVFRTFAGASWGNVLGLDHVAYFSYDTSPNFHDFQSFRAGYKAPIGKQGQLVLEGGYEKAFAKMTSGEKGEFFALSPAYKFTLDLGNRLFQRVSAGMCYKRTNTDLTVGGSSVASDFATLYNLSFGYLAKYRMSKHQVLHFSAKGNFQPFAIGNAMTEDVYRAITLGASNRYFYTGLKGRYSYRPKNPDFSVLAEIKAQVSSGPLMRVEQVNLGGVDSVRGYRHGAFPVDDALTGNFEILLPPLETKLFSDQLQDWGKLQLMGFYDIGWGRDLRSVEEGIRQKPIFLSGAGPGLVYRYRSRIMAKMNWGIRLSNPLGASGRESLKEISQGMPLSEGLGNGAEESLPKSQLYFSVVGSF